MDTDDSVVIAGGGGGGEWRRVGGVYGDAQRLALG